LTVAGFSVAVAAGAWYAPVGPHDAVPRGMAGLAAAGALVAAFVMRRWDRSAGKRVHELSTARSREEWRAEERQAELEVELDEVREARQKLEEDLRTRRAELARLRGEHADLLRRYATAETERARALESRRRLAIEAAAPAKAIAPPAARPLGPEAFRRADAARLHLARNAARQQAARTVEAAREREAAVTAADAEEPSGRHGRPAGPPRPVPPSGPGGLPSREHHLVPAVASAVLPYAQPPRPARTVGGFDFFGTHKAPSRPAEHTGPRSAPAAPARPAGPQDDAAAARPEVIDLTAHDDTEQLDVRELRSHG
jgi:hypothetical protein